MARYWAPFVDLELSDFGNVDIVVEAMVENVKVNQFVLAETEVLVKDTILRQTLPPSDHPSG